MNSIRYLVVAAFILFALRIDCGSARAFTAIAAGTQAAEMHRGMNALDDDPVWSDPSRGWFKPRHFGKLHDAGFDTVRLNLHPFAHSNDAGQIDAAWLAILDRQLSDALSAGLTAILDVHDDLACDRDVVACTPKLRAIWSQLALRYRDAPNRVLFEILNEPHGSVTAPIWGRLLRDNLAIIRRSNPERNVVIGPAGSNAFYQLKTLDLPENDRHIIVTFHYYWPLPFTHQGARWDPDTVNLSGITWGTAAERADIVKNFDGVRDWADSHHRPILLGEFGAIEKGDMDSRTRYLSAVARIAEAHGFAWAYWQFDSDFVAYDIKRDDWVHPILDALVPP